MNTKGITVGCMVHFFGRPESIGEVVALGDTDPRSGVSSGYGDTNVWVKYGTDAVDLRRANYTLYVIVSPAGEADC